MDNFRKSIAFILDNEGRTIREPNANSSELSKFGINQKYYPDIDVRALTEEQAIQIYKNDYWDANSLDLVVNEELATIMLDFVVNSGGGPKVIQRTVNEFINPGIAVDGVIGPLTIEAINSIDPYQLSNAIIENRLEYLKSLSNWQYEYNGWLSRIDKNYALIDSKKKNDSSGLMFAGIAALGVALYLFDS